MKNLFIKVRNSFIAFHRYKNAPDNVAFLRDFHRHNFKVEVTVRVNHDDREVEFFTLQKKVNDYLQENFEGKSFDLSCEQMAGMLLDKFNATYVVVSEDGESDGIAIAE